MTEPEDAPDVPVAPPPNLTRALATLSTTRYRHLLHADPTDGDNTDDIEALAADTPTEEDRATR